MLDLRLSAALLRRIVLTKDFVLRGSGKDLASYYFCLRHDKRWYRRSAVGKRVAKNVVRKYKEKYVGNNFDENPHAFGDVGCWAG